ncbi:MAG: hypothetical protein GY866_27445, partial [Proteobacteria bacterium]|nr:hypothetical protein [Pseudomonadota bacterium]
MNKCYVSSGVVYYPLQYDSSIFKEIEDYDSDMIVEIEGRKYLKGVKLVDIVTTSDSFKRKVGRQMELLMGRHLLNSIPRNIKPLIIAVFQVFPSFSRVRENHIVKRVMAPGYIKRAKKLIGFYEDADGHQALDYRLPEGLFRESEFKEVLSMLEDSMIPGVVRSRMEKRKMQSRRLKRNFSRTVQRLAVALRIDDHLNQDAVEYGKIGLFRKSYDTYCYLKVEEYCLMDRNRFVYKFPSCKVGVNIANPTDVVVIDHYRHPFLSGYGKMQQICFGTALKKR